MSIAKLKARLKTAAPTDLGLQLMQPIPGLPLALRAGDSPEERLPGMRRWVDRTLLERAMAAQGNGATPDEFLNQENSRSLLQKMVAGGGVGGVAGYHLRDQMKTSPLTAALLGVLGGGAAGGAYHLATQNDRDADAHEAYQGAGSEIARYPRVSTALPQNRQDESSAASVAPTLLHTGPSVVG